ncbi:MAG: hypothetical protein JXQ67_11205 [Campylobacterales bacterium]|nr:hypothetical protein [Campylobacterales bacterium]
MYKAFLLLLLAILLISCARPNSEVVHANEKVFEGEDRYIVLALRAEELRDNRAASSIFETLYKKSAKREYLYRSLENDLVAKDAQKLLNRADAYIQEFPDDVNLLRYKVYALIEMEKLEDAQNFGTLLAKKTNLADDYLLVGEVLIKAQKYDLALRYLDSAYAKEYNEKILDKISIILYVNLNRQKDAIAYLETHTRVHGCSKLIASRLLGFYSDQNNIEGLLSTYKRLYALEKNDDIAEKIIQIYTYKRDYIRLIDFLEVSGSDDALLLQLYSSAKNYKKAYPLAQKLYEKSADVEYLAQSAIYEYEAADKKAEPFLLENVVNKLERVVVVDKSPIYLNYLGYLLIDHNLDVSKGIQYIKKVLETEPESAYYLDSLAWGYYKLGECDKAAKIIAKVRKLEGGDNSEVVEHDNAIQRCLKN